MTSTSTTSRSKVKKTSNMLVKGVEWTAPNFKLVPAIAESLDPSGEQSRIPSKAAIPRVAWVKPLPYEINIDEARDIIEALINEPAIPNTPAFGTYDEAKARIELEIKLPKAITSTKRKAAKEIEETEEESEEEAETPKKKGKVVITKPKPKTAVFTRRTRKGQKESKVVFRKPPPTFEEKLKQVELTTILAKLENSFNNLTSFFAKLCDVTEFTKGIRDQLKKIDDDLKASAQRLHLDPSSSSTHHSNIRFLLDKQSELLREDARIRSTLLDIQNMILPNMDTMQKHITHSKTLIHDNIFSVAEHQLPRSQFSPSHQWLPSDTISTESPQLPSSKLHFGTSMDRASTLTESMTMPSTVVDAMYQKITEPA
ncbi:hypothetical protein SUGI_1046450 [Cryptomeria japonica]|nr:hypothetical protein SUGI_1046450 [Cryptomeria japonica]